MFRQILKSSLIFINEITEQKYLSFQILWCTTLGGNLDLFGRRNILALIFRDMIITLPNLWYSVLDYQNHESILIKTKKWAIVWQYPDSPNSVCEQLLPDHMTAYQSWNVMKLNGMYGIFDAISYDYHNLH